MKVTQRRKAPESYRKRIYRSAAANAGLVSTYISIKETDLHILAQTDVTKEADDLTTQFRLQIEQYIHKNPEFGRALEPIPEDILAPPIIRDMMKAGIKASVGPMAAVAGAVAEYVGRGLVEAGCREVIVENGGDLYLNRSRDCTIAIFAGASPLSNRVGIRVTAACMPIGICTSSASVGHSLSFGRADSVTVLAGSSAVADAAATRLGNEVVTHGTARDGVDRALRHAEKMSGILGVLVICEDTMGAVGDVEIVPVE